MARYDADGRKGLADRSRAPHCCPHKVPEEVATLLCHDLRSTQTLSVHAQFERLFREFGLPRAIRTDNGVPFATTGLHGLSTLSVWWIRLGDKLHFLSNALRHYPVGLEEVDDGLWSVYFCHVLLARIDGRTGTLTRG